MEDTKEIGMSTAKTTGCSSSIFSVADCWPITKGKPSGVVGCSQTQFDIANCDPTKNRVVIPPSPNVSTFWNTEQTASCPDGEYGDPITIPAHTYSSYLSQEEANSISLSVAQAALVCNIIPPPFSGCGPQNWPMTALGAPYTNIGDNITGFVQYAGSTSVHLGGFNPPGGFVPFSGVSPIIGGVLQTAPYQSFYGIPVTVLGDFTFQMDVYCDVVASRQVGPIIFSDAHKMGVWSYLINDGGAEMSRACDIATFSTYDILASGSAFTTPMLSWFTLSIQRVGSVLSFYYNGVLQCSYDFTVVFGVNIGMGWAGDSTFKFRNLSVTLP